jgi:F-type H+-transporting ATPase subunit delta
MSNATIVVDKYAKAAFGVAKKTNLSDIFVKDLDVFCQNITPFLKELSNPAISKSQISQIVGDITGKLKTNPQVSNFISMIAQARRLNIAGKIQEKLEALVKTDNKILQVELLSSHKLRKEQVEQTQKLLKEKYTQNEIESNEIIKSDILGGVVIKIGSFVIDNSIKNQLSNIANECKAII